MGTKGPREKGCNEMKVDELVLDMERTKGWEVTDGCIGVAAPKTQPGANMCPIVAMHWFRTGTKTWFTQSWLGLGLGLKDAVRVLKAADGAPGHDAELRSRMMGAAGLRARMT